MEYGFYGWADANALALNDTYADIQTPRDLYKALSYIWCEYTCAPRLRRKWSPENKTGGQCSITAFLVQDIDIYARFVSDTQQLLDFAGIRYY